MACSCAFKIIFLEECPAFLDCFALQDCLPRVSVNQAPKQAKVCPTGDITALK